MAALAIPPATLTIEQFVAMTADRRPYPEWVDGKIEERPVPSFLHSLFSGAAIAVVNKTGTLVSGPEVHSRVGRNYRLPDVAIWDKRKLPTEDYPSTPPLATIEVLSPGQSMTKMLKKCVEYERWGVKHIWLIDPEERALFVYRDGRITEVEVLEIPEHKLRITLADLLPAPESPGTQSTSPSDAPVA
ncbi:MAG: Uma2 family endonuclease [Bryobacteraceae bacterium]|nr:Uma2 family endonuclease [Bryobacteraceae bacterium]